jgi:hypothetical protein
MLLSHHDTGHHTRESDSQLVRQPRDHTAFALFHGVEARFGDIGV